MGYEIDHIFVLTDTCAPGADALLELGFTEGPPNRHEGQGTANRRFFFDNIMLELVWVESLEDARNKAVRPLLLADRWLGRSLNASPFGICLRPSDTQTRLPPFESYEYRPSYFPAGLAAHIGLDTSLAEPLWFFMDYRPAFLAAARHAPRHRVGVRRITGVTVMLPQPPSLVTTAAARASGVEMRIGPEHHLRITFDGGQNGCVYQFSPTLPMEFQ